MELFAESVSPHEYLLTRSWFLRGNPDTGWVLGDEDPTLQGTAYYLPGTDVYCVLRWITETVVSVHGVFSPRAYLPRRFPERATAQVLDLCRTLGAQTVELDCYAHIRHLWEREGMVEYKRDAWDDRYAPSLWESKHGRPDVLYMRKHFGG